MTTLNDAGGDLRNRYLNDPCGTLANAYWKENWFSKPDGLIIVHESELTKNEAHNGMRYFRLIHHMENMSLPCLLQGFSFRKPTLPDEAGIVADFINRCYEGYAQTGENVLRWTDYPVYDADLWIFAWDKSADKPAALGIADFDKKIGEGSLEWIQTLPHYRGKGIGQAIVLELLARLTGRAKFVTVSGEKHNKSNPEGLYRKCGFVGSDVWVVISA